MGYHDDDRRRRRKGLFFLLLFININLYYCLNLSLKDYIHVTRLYRYYRFPQVTCIYSRYMDKRGGYRGELSKVKDGQSMLICRRVAGNYQATIRQLSSKFPDSCWQLFLYGRPCGIIGAGGD